MKKEQKINNLRGRGKYQQMKSHAGNRIKMEPVLKLRA